MAALTGLLGDYGTDDESMATGREGTVSPSKAELGEAEVSSRPASAMPGVLNAAPAERLDTIPEEDQEMQPADQDPLELQLPSEIAQPLDQLCSAEDQERVSHYLQIQKDKGRFINIELRSSRGYRNPDFLSHTVEHFQLDPHGTCYPKEIFDPHNLPKEDFHDALLAEFSQWQEKKRHHQQQSQSIDFAKGGTIKASGGAAGLQSKAQVAAMQAKAQAVVAAAQHRGGKWDSGPGR